MKPTDPFPGLLRAFFYDWMIEQRIQSSGASAFVPRPACDF